MLQQLLTVEGELLNEAMAKATFEKEFNKRKKSFEVLIKSTSMLPKFSRDTRDTIMKKFKMDTAMACCPAAFHTAVAWRGLMDKATGEDDQHMVYALKEMEGKIFYFIDKIIETIMKYGLNTVESIRRFVVFITSHERFHVDQFVMVPKNISKDEMNNIVRKSEDDANRFAVKEVRKYIDENIVFE